MVPPDMYNEEVRGALVSLALSMALHTNRDVGPRVNFFTSTMTSTLTDFVRMNPPTFLGFKVGEDPQEFLNEGYREKVSWLHANSKRILKFGTQNGRSIGQLNWVL